MTEYVADDRESEAESRPARMTVEALRVAWDERDNRYAAFGVLLTPVQREVIKRYRQAEYMEATEGKPMAWITRR